MADLLGLLGFVGVAALAASSGILVRPGAWYRFLDKPAWRPPDWLFGPVWLVLYLMIASSGWLVWREHGLEGAGLALAVYAVQLVLNALWSIIFFGLKRTGTAAVELAALWVSIVATMAVFHPLHGLAAYLLIPYALWVGFALVLNIAIWRRNRKSGRILTEAG